MKDFFYIKHFIVWEIFWACFSALLGFLFILSKGDFNISEDKLFFIGAYIEAVALVVLIFLFNAGALRAFGVGVENRGKYLINKYMGSPHYVDSSISDKDLEELYLFLIKKPTTAVIRTIYYGTIVISILFIVLYFSGMGGDNLIIVLFGGFLTIALYCFLRTLLNEILTAPLLQKAKETMYTRSMKVDGEQKNLFSLKNRFLYFVSLFLILMVVALSGVDNINITLIAFIVLVFVMVLIISRILFLSIYSVLMEIDQFARELPAPAKTTYLTGSSYKEAIKLSKNLNKSAERLHEVRIRMEREKDRVKAIINNFQGPIIFVNADNKIALFNKAAQEVLGIKDGDYDKEISDDNNFALNNFKKVIHKRYKIEKKDKTHQEENEDEIVNFKYKGKEITYKVKTARVYDEDNNYYGIVKVFYDLTTEKAIDRAKSKFISIAAHQLRTPLSSIKWIIKMALDGDIGKFNEEQADLLNKAYTSNQRIIRLIDDLLNVSRIEEGKFGYNVRRENLGKILDNAIGELDHKVNNKDLKFKFHRPKEKFPVYVDKEKINLALQNIIDNAIKYTPEKGEITVKAEKRDGQVTVIVRDSGCGIPKKEQKKLFTKFFRASNISGTKIGGSGLGLFIAKNIVEGHGGSIDLKSEENKGTKVTIFLPMNKKQNV